MATKHQRRSIAANHAAACVLSLVLLLIFAGHGAQAQAPLNENTNNNNPSYLSSAKFNPSMAIIIVVLISVFFLLGFFAIYIRQCGGGQIDSLAATAAAAIGGRSRRLRGLDSAVLATFPTIVYSEVKEHKIGKGELECAICLNEFDADEYIRLLPKCDHVFHRDCIDAWLSTHVTCPVCRTNYAIVSDDPHSIDLETDTPAPPETAPASDPTPPTSDHVVISVDDGDMKRELKELALIASRVRRNGSRRSLKLLRSHSTGHSIMREGSDRFTLRLPEKIRKEIIAAGILHSVAGGGGGEESSRFSRGIGEGSSRRGRSVRLGRSDRWPSFLVRSLSSKIPAWGSWRRSEGASMIEGSVRGKLAGGGWTKQNSTAGSEELSTAALNPV